MTLSLESRSIGQAFIGVKSNFRKGGANLLVCLDAQQGVATFSEITFGKQSIASVSGRRFAADI